MSKKVNDIVTSALFLALVFGFMLLAILTPDEDISVAERRPLQQVPVVNMSTIASGESMTDFSSYAADQFPLRDAFRGLKSKIWFNLYQQKDNNGVYMVDGNVNKLDFPLNEGGVEHFIDRMNYVYDRYLEGTTPTFVFVPDKNYYFAEANGYPAMDYDAMKQMLMDGLPQMAFVDLSNTLFADNYYVTDPHWRSEDLFGSASQIGSVMGFQVTPKEIAELEVPYYGSYFGQAPVKVEADTIFYPVDDAINAATVTDVDRGQEGGVYWGEGEENDRYTVFLNGSSSLLEIRNPLAESDRRLIMFRDSFASSITPWFIDQYSEIIMVDIRYISPVVLSNFVDFENAEVMFMYSSGVINHSETIK